MDPGIAGLAGTAIGGVIGVVGTLASTRLAGRDQRRNQHEHWRRQQRRDAYSQLLSQSSEAIRLGTAATDAYEGDEASAVDLAPQFEDAVRRLDAAESLVALEGPQEAALAAMELVGALHVWTNMLGLAIATDEGHYVPSMGEASVGVSTLLERKEKTYESSDAFIQLCRDLLDS